MDAVGLDVVLCIQENYARRPGLPEAARTLLKKMIADGPPWRKERSRFYDFQ